MYDVITIADQILKIAKRAGRSLTPLQLMKLVYIAHGFSLGLGREDLFQNRIEAWKYGPVIPDLYHATKEFGRGSIPKSLVDETQDSVDHDTAEFLQDVFNKYGHLTGFSLSNLTHQSGTPWDQVYEDGVPGIEIPDDLIRQHYEGIVVGRGVTAA